MELLNFALHIKYVSGLVRHRYYFGIISSIFFNEIPWTRWDSATIMVLFLDPVYS